MKNITINLSNPGTKLDTYIPENYKQHRIHEKMPAMLVIPGGGYRLCSEREGEPIAFAFNGKGYAAFVLYYTVDIGQDTFSKAMEDANEAMKIIHENADKWGIDSDRISAIGFSAGAHLCASLATYGDIRPRTQILGYACLLKSMNEKLGMDIPAPYDFVDENTCPAFLVASSEDNVVPIANSLEYCLKLDKYNIPFEIHSFSKGYHGFSLGTDFVYCHKEDFEYNKHVEPWFDLCIKWLDKTMYWD